ncbi:Nonribosomal peptide synthase (NRPS) [Penicillium ucsense]|uniref:Nonribosomal peptide synthase (NRPS) n=1 Tax=Penicillium ucsense TaxID=2839758 RepID=A0A8J8W6M0_9EURO|nr:Nonribosomal peptide synthase (NRPS) [Penicillium ucsense]KAF7737890.1 Nonribosomal peptide synthase (NRPS) [Penicillium ucsense]
MSYTQAESMQASRADLDSIHQESGQVDTNYHISSQYEISVLSCDDDGSPTGLRENVVLLAWLICLLRTSEDGKASFEWRYEDQLDGSPAGEVAALSSDEVLPALQNSIEGALLVVTRHISDAKGKICNQATSSQSLVLSTGPLNTNEDSQDDINIQIGVSRKIKYLNIRPRAISKKALPYTIARHVHSLAETIKLCVNSPGLRLESLLGPTNHDLDMIWRWNHNLPPTYDFCMHDLISTRAKEFPNKEAIASWDGALTYSEVDDFSNHLAIRLHAAGVALNDFVPVCFEKSRWTIVAVLAVMKAGGTMVLMDPTLPLARLQNMACQVNAKHMILSENQKDLASCILPEGVRINVGVNTFTNMPKSQSLPALSVVPTSALMYVIFTSGSTGTPKGVTISHRTYTSSAIPRAAAVGYKPTSRVLDFASYAFDVSIDSMLLTLGNGGCLCIPSDEDRLNDINEVIRTMKINYAGITPSMARILDADVIKSLDILGLGGEAASATDVNSWGRDTRIVIGYGPCECTIGCTINSSAATGKDYISIGQGNGAAIWIVDPNDHEVLMPVGAVGELLVEGPIVGQGYLNDPEKTAAAFINDPSWLVRGHEKYRGRNGRLYKTGDLGMYDPDGSGAVVFVGRKDTQVKLRGQRVELGEIESQLNSELPSEATVVAEVITPKRAGNQSILVAFISFRSAIGQEHLEIDSAQLTPEQSTALSVAKSEVSKVLPRYMIPTAYLSVNYIPTLISGKTDRKRLRQFGTSVDLRAKEQDLGESIPREMSELESTLRQAWSQVLKIEAQTILPEDNFFALGGDSLAAMSLVSLCREKSVDLSVLKVFDSPTLREMAANAGVLQDQVASHTTPFSMLTQTVESACVAAASACGVVENEIEDIYPATPTQESLFTFSLKSEKAYIAQRVACIPTSINVNDWKRAWEAVVTSSPILRSRLVQLQDPGLQQVVLKEKISWKHHQDLVRYLEDDCLQKMHLGHSLARYAVVDDLACGKRYMVWTVHHALYDGWSEPVILEQIQKALQGSKIERICEMRHFVKYVQDTNESEMVEFWRRELNGAIGPQFPRLPHRDYLPKPTVTVERFIPFASDARSNFTLATFIRAAWALVASQYIRNDDVLFGETLTGRDIPLPGVERIVGPLIATVPIRIRIARNSTAEEYLQAVQKSILCRASYQHMGMQNIRKVSRDAQHACEAGTGLVIQPEPDYEGDDLGFLRIDAVQEAIHFNPYPLMLACGIRNGGFRVCANFDGELVGKRQMERMLAQLEVTCSELAKNPSRRIDQISCLHEDELNEIWRRNALAPLAYADFIKPGSTYPPPVVQWICNPRNPSLLTPIGCPGEMWLEGDCLSGKTLDSPAWLRAGSSKIPGRVGKLQATGDIVQQQEDGKILFLGRKDDVVLVNGQPIEIADLEIHFSRYLPSSARAAIGVRRKTSHSPSDDPEPSLTVMFEERHVGTVQVRLMPKSYNVSDGSDCSALNVHVRASASTELILAIRSLDKFYKDSLPTHMIPGSYIVIDSLPARQELLDQVASLIPSQISTAFKHGLQEAWKKSLSHSHLSDPERILRSEWAKVLSLREGKIETDDNFFRLGGDSVLAMKLVASLRNKGHTLTIADVFQHMRLRDAATRLKLGQVERIPIQSYKPFTLVDPVEAEQIVSEIRQNKLGRAACSVQDVFPVTDTQTIDIHGTIRSPRTPVQYNTLYFNQKIDLERLHRACRRLVEMHDILRTVFVQNNGRFFQAILSEIEVQMMSHHTDTDLVSFVSDFCARDIECEFPLGSAFYKFIHASDEHGHDCLIFAISHALYDGISLPRLLEDLEALYSDASISSYAPFSSYIARTLDTCLQVRSLGYWSTLLEGSSLSVLDGLSANQDDRGVFLQKAIECCQPPQDFTVANILTAAWSLLLARRLRKPDVTFGSVTSGRMIDLVNVENVVGPCYQLAPVRVQIQPKWTATDLLCSVRKQMAESAAHDFLGFEKISKQCTSWPQSAGLFDSIVHHQDFDDFDSMPFAGGSCRVEIYNPHGDAPLPFKAVSFVRSGQVHVGAVGSTRDLDLVSELLDDLASIFAEVCRCSESVLLDAAVF